MFACVFPLFIQTGTPYTVTQVTVHPKSQPQLTGSDDHCRFVCTQLQQHILYTRVPITFVIGVCAYSRILLRQTMYMYISSPRVEFSMDLRSVKMKFSAKHLRVVRVP